MRRHHGFSLVELLVVIAIIGILAIMQVQAGVKAIRQAKAVATGEAMRQNKIGQMSDGKGTGSTREQCRAAFRQMYNTGKFEAAITEMRYTVRNDQEFDAYYHTLVDPDATGDLVIENNRLKAKTRDGTVVYLEPLSDRTGGVPTMWEFLATNMAHMTTGTNIKVMYNDGHVDTMQYPGRFPASRMVAELGEEFIRKTS